ncbi:class I SAM-dependent methyltransferase [Leptospirillum ferriphilum]|jgi:ubiquinone/menaquinone biosynthesis C-methylase UbiE|uniref:Methyltransferase, UbiE/COQ5 family n=2 Tax=Leptospirillum TaxID=179 RepID=A0A094WD40_9BACT|nr:class I SAM-dependent methyltransferase [Leptospirillum ferriphilum]EDZ38895.1 MAG: Putative methyltransferase [Leptospirillum sp. Group II '5-way CG']KGA93547.1 methyltransferase, UbiE/COQ5 family [Leptospirillum ferriphilum]
MKSASWPDRLFAAWYDRLMQKMEENTFRPVRKRLLKHARGHVLEIGVGTGANASFYEDRFVSGKVFLDSSFPMLQVALRKGICPPGTLVLGSGSELPFSTGIFDTVVVTLVLCSVNHWEQAIREIRRVLSPRGHLIVLEHVQSRHPVISFFQSVLTPVWKIPARGCHLDRPTDQTLGSCFEWIERDQIVLSGMPFVFGRLTPRPEPECSGNIADHSLPVAGEAR